MTFTDEIRVRLGIPRGDVDQATILEALDEALAECWTEEPGPASGSDPGEHMTMLETDVYEQLCLADRAGREAQQELLATDRDRLIAEAISDGRTTPERRGYWNDAWAADPEQARAYLAQLSPGLDPDIAAELARHQEPETDEYAALYGDLHQER